jgi:hypothetical protein
MAAKHPFMLTVSSTGPNAALTSSGYFKDRLRNMEEVKNEDL